MDIYLSALYFKMTIKTEPCGTISNTNSTEAEAGGLQDQGQLEQQSEFKARLSNFDLNIKTNE